MVKNSNEVKELIEKLRLYKDLLKTQFGVRKIWIFGSYARGDFSEKSDVDILVELDKPIGLKFLQLKDFLEQKLNRKVDLTTKKALKNPYIKQTIEGDLLNVF